MSVPPLPLRFVLSAPEVAQLPPTPAEVAVAGRSNVGKSSVINALANRRKLAAVSGTPGRTRLLNLFELRPDNDRGSDAVPTFVDLPGYGHAEVPQHVRAKWGPMIETYLTERENLHMVVVLVDALVGPTRLDLDMLGWVRHHDIPHSVVATKHDKVKASVRDRRRRELAAACDLDESDVLWVSAAKGTNVDELRRRVRRWLGI